MITNYLIPISTLIISSIISVFLGYKSNELSKKRDVENKNREIRVGYLISAYRDIELCVHKVPLTIENKKNLERAIADIMLLGNKEEIDSLKKLHKDPNSQESIQILLNSIRKSLRKELNLELDNRNILYYRIN